VNLSKTAIGLLALVLLSGAIARAQTTAPAEDAEAKYLADIDNRASKIVATLGITDDAASNRVHDLIRNQYRDLRMVHDPRDAAIKEAKGDDARIKTITEEADTKIKALHDAYLANLAKDLSPEQVEKVKDGMTSGKVDFTFRGYMVAHPNMNDVEKAKVVEFLKQAREIAMDQGSSKDKDAVFNKFKGRINNWLAAQEKARKAATQSTTQPAN